MESDEKNKNWPLIGMLLVAIVILGVEVGKLILSLSKESSRIARASNAEKKGLIYEGKKIGAMSVCKLLAKKVPSKVNRVECFVEYLDALRDRRTN